MPRHSSENPYLAQSAWRRQAVSGFFVSIFTVAVLVVLLTPLLSIPVSPKSTLPVSPAPELFTSEGLNSHFLADAGAWFESHIGFRDEVVTADAYVHTTLFATSNTDEVVTGVNGWLYPGSTTADYLGASEIGDASLENIVFNLELIQRSLSERGTRLVFTVAPNKNTVYPEWMPYNYLAGTGQAIAERLSAKIASANLTYVDLFVTLANAKAVSGSDVYYAHDSHWNARGARAAAEALFNALAITPDFTGRYTEGEHTGDLDRILYPAFSLPETCDVLISNNAYARVGETTSSALIQTERTQQMSEFLAADAPERLLFLGDSFAEELIEPLSSEFSAALYSEAKPADLTLADAFSPTVVVIERAECDLPAMAYAVPRMLSPEVTNVAVSASVPSSTTCAVEEEAEGLLRIFGSLDKSVADAGSSYYLELHNSVTGQTHVYEAWRRTLDDGNANGYEVLVPASLVSDGASSVRVIALRGGSRTSIFEMSI